MSFFSGIKHKIMFGCFLHFFKIDLSRLYWICCSTHGSKRSMSSCPSQSSPCLHLCLKRQVKRYLPWVDLQLLESLDFDLLYWFSHFAWVLFMSMLIVCVLVSFIVLNILSEINIFLSLIVKFIECLFIKWCSYSHILFDYF